MNQDDSRSIISFSLRGWVRIIQVDHHWYLSGMNEICMIERRSFLVAKGFQFPSRTSFNFGIKDTPWKHAMTVDKLEIGNVEPKFLGSMWDLGEGIFASISQFVYSTKKSFMQTFQACRMKLNNDVWSRQTYMIESMTQGALFQPPSTSSIQVSRMNSLKELVFNNVIVRMVRLIVDSKKMRIKWSWWRAANEQKTSCSNDEFSALCNVLLSKLAETQKRSRSM